MFAQGKPLDRKNLKVSKVRKSKDTILTKSSGSDDETVWSATIAVGRNAAENDALFSKAKQTDIWFHLHNLPSAHVYLSTIQQMRR